MDSLKKKRDQLDKIDSKIMKLLEERFDISIEVGRIKEEENIEVTDSNREEVILSKTTNYRHSPQIRNIYKELMIQSKNLQRK